MAPKVNEKQQDQHNNQSQKNNIIAVKHSNNFHISALTLCHNKRLRLKRSKYGEFLRNTYQNKRFVPQPIFKKTEIRRQKLSLLQADITIDLLSDDEEEKKPVIVYPESMCLERAAILGLMPVERLAKPPISKQILREPHDQVVDNTKETQKTDKQHRQKQHHVILPKSTNTIHRKDSKNKRIRSSAVNPLMPKDIKLLEQQDPVMLIPMPKQFQQQAQPRKRKSKPQKRHSLPATPRTPILINTESIVLSDDSNDAFISMPPRRKPVAYEPLIQPPELSVTCPTSSQIPCLPQQNTMQVDEEVTISLVPRSLNATTCTSRSPLTSPQCATAQQSAFAMLPDETTVHTVIANRIYELSLTKLREGLASCGIPEFADGQQKISPQRRKGLVHQPPLVSPPQAPVSLKLSSDLSISLISDDEDDIRQKNCRDEPILSPAFLQKLPVNVSIAPVPMLPPNCNRATESRKLRLG